MAKVGFWLRGARGKLAGSVLHKSPNGTIAREKVDPKNPKTFSQATQRAIFATVTRTASFLRPVISNSFDGAKNGENDVRAFVKANVAHLRNLYNDGKTVCLQRKGEYYALPNGLIISQGSLGDVYGQRDDARGSYCYFGQLKNQGNRIFSVDLGSLRQYVNDNIRPGAQLTFVTCYNSAFDDEDGSFSWAYGRIVLNNNISDSTPIVIIDNSVEGIVKIHFNVTAIDPSKTEGFAYNELNEPLLATEHGPWGSWTFSNELDEGTDFYVGGNQLSELYSQAFGIIVSNYDKNTNKWLHSNSILGLSLDPDFYNIVGDNTKRNIPTYMAAAKTASSSDWYTEQSDGLGNTDFEPTTLNQGFSGSVQVSGYTEKVLNI